MNTHQTLRFPASALLAAALAAGPAALAADEARPSDAASLADAVSQMEAQRIEAEPKTQAQEDVQPEVDERAATEAQERRESLADEAVEAMELTRQAMSRLSGEEPDPQGAIDAIERAVGKLEVLIARDPGLALLPVAVQVRETDLVARTQTVERLIDAAEDALEDGRVQEARGVLANLASEAVVETTQLPVATYPAALRAAVPLIDAGRTDAALAQIQSALNQLVVSEVVYPLPLLRAEAMLAAAEALAEEPGRSGASQAQLDALLEAAREELAFGETLGYYDQAAVAPLYGMIDEIGGKTEEGGSGTGFFDRIKRSLSGLF